MGERELRQPRNNSGRAAGLRGLWFLFSPSGQPGHPSDPACQASWPRPPPSLCSSLSSLCCPHSLPQMKPTPFEPSLTLLWGSSCCPFHHRSLSASIPLFPKSILVSPEVCALCFDPQKLPFVSFALTPSCNTAHLPGASSAPTPGTPLAAPCICSAPGFPSHPIPH